MKLVDLYREGSTEPRKQKPVTKYEMETINGGFSNGVDINNGQTAGTMTISVNIYGGNQKSSKIHEVPPSIKIMQEALIAAERSGDPIANELKKEINSYYNNLKKAISLEVIQLMKQLDYQASEKINSLVSKINNKYQ